MAAPHAISTTIVGYPQIIPRSEWPKSSKTIAREKAKAEEAARVALEVAKLRATVIPSLKPLRGKLWSIDAGALLLIGPAGGVAIPASAVPTLEPLAAGGRHALDERARAALAKLADRLAAVGLRVNARREGVRIAKAKVSSVRPASP